MGRRPDGAVRWRLLDQPALPPPLIHQTRHAGALPPAVTGTVRAIGLPWYRSGGGRFACAGDTGGARKGTLQLYGVRPRPNVNHRFKGDVMAAERGRGGSAGGIGVGGILVIVGVVLMIVWSFWIGLIIALIGLIAFGGFARGKWY